MPLAFIFGSITSLFGKDLKNAGFNIAKYVAWAAYIGIILGVFFASIFTLLDSVAVAVPSLAVQVWGWFMPPNAAGCLTVIISARVLRSILDYKVAMSSKRLQMLRSN